MTAVLSTIVFTKNRPMQLHGYLESLFRYFPKDKIQTLIVWKEEKFREQYHSLFREFPDCRVIREGDFHTDLLQILREVQTPYLLFGVDDVVFFDGVDLGLIEKAFLSQAKDLFGFSLRLGPDMAKEELEAGAAQKQRVDEQEFYLLDWRRGKSSHTCYPFELCATVYPTERVRHLVECRVNRSKLWSVLFRPNSGLMKKAGAFLPRRKIYKRFGYFFNPNTFESWACRWCKQHPDEVGPLLAFQKSCATAIQVNLVNTSTRNEWDDCAELTVEALAEKYRAGWRIDIEAIARQRPTQTHSGREFFHLKGPEGNHVHI